ncbi:hypothetical protein ACLESD_01445 [Pyxidicoccus sp. 3LFB2]
MVHPTGSTFAQLAVDYRKLQVDELAKSLRAYVRHVYNVPPELVGDTSSSNRNTSEAAKYHLPEYTVAMHLEFLFAWVQYRLVPLVNADVILDMRTRAHGVQAHLPGDDDATCGDGERHRDLNGKRTSIGGLTR